ncbi:MAG: hypothetical protein IPK22_24945 [Verrucomicrobiaceae bacterium]|nr:hypothetical protein [Verrucomicrobiaceae bacterium]
MSTSSSRVVARILIILSCLTVGATAGVCLSALQITSQPQVFRSLAKIVANASSQPQDVEPDYFGIIIETLESAELSRKAQERVQALHPELKDSPVEIRVARSKGSAIFNVLASGSEPKYTQIFLNAMVDEYIAFRRQVSEHAKGAVLDVSVMERATTPMEHITDWKMPIILGGIGGAVFGVVIGALGCLLFTLLGQPKAPQS